MSQRNSYTANIVLPNVSLSIRVACFLVFHTNGTNHGASGSPEGPLNKPELCVKPKRSAKFYDLEWKVIPTIEDVAKENDTETRRTAK